jgi:Tol biopolymer transport system component
VRDARTHRVLLRTRGEAGPVRFSPDSRSVAFLEVRPSWTLVNYDLASGKRRILARRLHLSDEPPQPIEWSATGDRIAVACATSVIVVPRDGGRVLTFDHVWPLRHPIAPMRWIGSRTLVLTMAVQYNDREVYVADAATGKAVAITHNRVDDNHHVLAPDKRSVAYVRGGAVRIVQLDGSHDRRVHAGSSPAWSPTGELALVDRGKIELVDPVTGALRRVLVTGDEPDWTPDGSAIAYAYDGDIWAVAPDGSGPHPITSDPVFHRMPAYSPDGKRIAYRAVVDNSAGTYAADAADGSHVTRLSDTGRDPSWSPDGSKVMFEYFDGTLRIVDSADGAHAKTFSPAPGWSGAPDWR